MMMLRSADAMVFILYDVIDKIASPRGALEDADSTLTQLIN